MNILVTGSSGYIGRNYIHTYKNQYNFFRFSLQENSIDTLNLESIDTILHCAALVHQHTSHDYEKYHAVNVDYPIALAEKAKAAGVKHFIFLSTVAVYGNHQAIYENTIPAPITHYGKSKHKAEIKLLTLNDKSFIVSIIRPSMVYGHNSPGNMSSLINLINKVPILPFSNIKNSRNFIYIENLTQLIKKIIDKREHGIFLAADDEFISTSHLIERIAKELNRKIYLIEIPFFKDILKLLKPSLHNKLYGSLIIDNYVTKESLNYQNPYSFNDGIKYMLEDKKR